MTATLEYLNRCDSAEFVRMLAGIYERSPWITERASAMRPFENLTALKLALQNVVGAASQAEQLNLIRAHPELAGKAAIAGEHARAKTAAATDWQRIVELYDLLLAADPSPVVELNRAAAIALRDGPAAGLPLLDGLLARGDLADYQLAFAARADLLRQLGRTAEAGRDYRQALALARRPADRRFLERRLGALD